MPSLACLKSKTLKIISLDLDIPVPRLVNRRSAYQDVFILRTQRADGEVREGVTVNHIVHHDSDCTTENGGCTDWSVSSLDLSCESLPAGGMARHRSQVGHGASCKASELYNAPLVSYE